MKKCCIMKNLKTVMSIRNFNIKRKKHYFFFLIYVILMNSCTILDENITPKFLKLISADKTEINFRNIILDALNRNIFTHVNTTKKHPEIGDSLKNIPLDIMPGYKVEKLLASEFFSDNLDRWLAEGKVITKINHGWLYMESFDTKIENPKGNIWWKNNFKNPYLIEFDYQSLSDEGLTMIFWNAFGLDGNDIFSWERTGKYVEYVNSNLTAYHCSFHRFRTGLSNLRKAPGFHLVASVKDPIDTKDRKVHKVMVASAGNRQRIFVDGKLVHDFIDNGKPCLSEGNWQHPLPCEGTGAVPDHGAFGIRMTQKQKAKFDNFRAYRLTQIEE